MSSASDPAYVTLFDRTYLPRGVAMLGSLESSIRARPFPGRCIVHTIDEETCSALRVWSAGRDWIEVRAPEEVMRLDASLPELRRSRSAAAFCWTLTPLVLRDALRSGTHMAIYVDADLWFHSDPSPLLTQLACKDASVHITPHGFAAHADRSASVGRYCVQFLPVRNDAAGVAVVERWARQCLSDCPEAGSGRPPGDQGYLDEWPAIHGGAVAEWDTPGVGLGPWNRERHRIRRVGGRLLVSRDHGPWSTLLFVHHQDVKWSTDGRLDEGRMLSWPLDASWLRLALIPYIASCAEIGGPTRMQRAPSWAFWMRWLRHRTWRRVA